MPLSGEPKVRAHSTNRPTDGLMLYFWFALGTPRPIDPSPSVSGEGSVYLLAVDIKNYQY